MRYSSAQQFCRRLVPAIVILAVASTATRGEDWPQFRGPNRDNKVTGFQAPTTWPKELTKKWSVSVGDGVASPALVGDKIYTFTRQGGDEVTQCLDLATGKTVWSEKYAADAVTGIAAGRGNDKFTGPRSSPAVGEGKVCTFGVASVLSCYDAATGKEIWKKETKGRPMFYTSTSPLIVDGKCIIHTGSGGKGGGKGDLTAYDLTNGETKWKWSGDGPGYGSPVVATIAGTKQIVEITDSSLIGVALADGKLLWKTPLTTGRYQSGTPTIDGDTVIISGYAFLITKSNDSFNAKQVWKDQAPIFYNSPTEKDGVLYGLSDAGRNATKLYAQDAKTGKVLWGDAGSGGQCGEILDAGTVMFQLSSNGKLVAFKPDKKDYTEVATYKVANGGTYATPVITGNRILVKDSDALTLWAIE
jgi:outer membrane protein assembly factor BamB